MTGNNGRGIVLQERDRHLLREVAVMSVIDREQTKCVAGFGSTTRANNRLLALTRAGLLRRFFQGTTAGGKKALYALSQTGANLVDAPYRGLRRSRDEILVADFFVTHQLSVNQIYCALKYQPIPFPDARFLRWVSFHSPIGSGSSLIPDGYVEVAVANKILAAFLEVDLGHESRAVWKAKVQAYLRYAVTGDFAKQNGQPQFRALVVANSERRMNSLRVATAELTDKIFWFTEFESIHRDGFWSSIWRRPKDDRRQSLF
jgi:hypothetical protein